MPVNADEKTTHFLPSAALFKPLQADPREARTALARSLRKPQWEASVGRTVEFVQWGRGPARGAWGITGAAFAWLDQHGTSFPLRDSDWWVGTYLARKKGRLSQKLEYTHVSTHLGDALTGERERIVYSREMLRLLLAAESGPRRRTYLGAGYWIKTIPDEKPWFLQIGSEQDFAAGHALGQVLDVYLAYDFKAKQEAGGVVNHSFQTGFKLRSPTDASRSVRLGFGFTSGHNEFGQFYRERDTHWTFGLNFD